MRDAGSSSDTSERVFLVGVEFRSRRGRKSLTPAARAARDSARLSARAMSEARDAREAPHDDEGDDGDGVARDETGPAENKPKSGKGARPERPEPPGVSAAESMDELRELARSAGAQISGEFMQTRDRPDPATLIGRGKLQEIAGAVASVNADLVLFDHDLTASQQRNVEKELGCRVIDRTQLILDIFARHARTREGQLQVELAQLEYMLPRLAGRGVEMSQLGGGIGTRGPGETQLETDRRKIHRRIRDVQQSLEKVRRTRAQQRARRESGPAATVALVGYTNAGKSTLFNALSGATVLESARMFATLDPTLRSVTLPSKRKVLVSDTVGFIRNLPHALVTSFRATLEEVQRAALVLHVADAAAPPSLAAEQAAQVEKVLEELGALDKPRIMVMNKIDLLTAAERERLRDSRNVVYISARDGSGLDQLLLHVDKLLEQDPISRVRLRIPQSEGRALSVLEAKARILERKYRAGAVEMEVEAPESVLRGMKAYLRAK